MNGNKPKGGSIVIANGQVTTDSTMIIGDYDVSYNPTNKKYEATEKGNASTTTVVYRWSTTDIINIGDTINPGDIVKFTKDASTLGKSYYLKHVLDKDNKVTESYACAILKDKEYCLTVLGVEYGWSENEADYTGNMLILKNLKDAKIEGISCNFSEGNSGSYCNDDSVTLRVYPYGNVTVTDIEDGHCSVTGDGGSICMLKPVV